MVCMGIVICNNLIKRNALFLEESDPFLELWRTFRNSKISLYNSLSTISSIHLPYKQ